MLHTNIIHRIDAEPDCLEALAFQRSAASQHSLRSTSLICLPALLSPLSLAVADQVSASANEELGLHFHGFQCDEVKRRFHTTETAFWLLPRPIRTGIIDLMMERFHARFGYFPTSVGCYILDAWTLNYIKRNHPSVTVAITSCFEEGVKMFHGNNHNWNLFSDGGPWGPFYPSRACALIPAQDESEAIGLVALPHLSRDMLFALTSRDDYFASHPGNLVRARLNDGDQCPYLFRLIDSWRRQVDHNGWSYLSVFVSSPWLLSRHWTVENVDEVRSLYRHMLAYLAKEETDGRVRTSTMSGFAHDFRKISTPGSPSLCHWKDELTQSQREIVWLCNSHFRIALDMNAGGAIVDLRPYRGRLDRNLGPETAAKWNGSHPFVISSELRGGPEQSVQTFEIAFGEATIRGIERRGFASVERLSNRNGWAVKITPLTYEVGGIEVEISSTWEFDDTGDFCIRRTVTRISQADARIRLSELLRGTWGTTEYPESIDDGYLVLATKNGIESKIPIKLSGGEPVAADATSTEVFLRDGNFRLRLDGNGDSRTGSLTDGTLFLPHYTLRLGKDVGLNETLVTWLKIAPISSAK